jgi:hypothetical protein
MNTYVYLWQYLAELFLEWEMFQKKLVDNIKTHNLCSITLFRKSCRLWDNVENMVQPDRPHDNIMRVQRREDAICLPDN